MLKGKLEDKGLGRWKRYLQCVFCLALLLIPAIGFTSEASTMERARGVDGWENVEAAEDEIQETGETDGIEGAEGIEEIEETQMEEAWTAKSGRVQKAEGQTSEEQEAEMQVEAEEMQNIQNVQKTDEQVSEEQNAEMQLEAEEMQNVQDVHETDEQVSEVPETQDAWAAEINESDGVQELLAAIIFCEAGNQPYEGQVAVGAVVMNRVYSDAYPNSVEEVIYQSGQFGPAITGWLDQVRGSAGYTEAAMQAAADALAGVNPVGDCLYFDQGGYGMQIGDHYFH